MGRNLPTIILDTIDLLAIPEQEPNDTIRDQLIALQWISQHPSNNYFGKDTILSDFNSSLFDFLFLLAMQLPTEIERVDYRVFI